MIGNYNKYCVDRYLEVYNAIKQSLRLKGKAEAERAAQKEAIKVTVIEAFEKYPKIESCQIWQAIYAAHVSRKSGIIDPSVINAVISADNSWKKSSGHAFEEAVKALANKALSGTGIQMVLQRDLSKLVQYNLINNELRDMKWLKEQLNSSNFDLYMTVQTKGQKQTVFGCVQTKTSIRDRVTRDREPSIHAMGAFFWSVAFVLDGAFLKLPKFKCMVNGDSPSFPSNGWHGFYVFSEQYSIDRIYYVGENLKTFVEHAKKSSAAWLKQRQWIDINWKA